MAAAEPMPAWRTIRLGTYPRADGLRRALHEARCAIGLLARAALDRPGFPLADGERSVELAVVSAGALGAAGRGASLGELAERARQCGLALCPAEVAPQLRLQYRDQPVGEFLRVAMAPVVVEHGIGVGLCVANGGAGLALIGGEASPHWIAAPRVRFVFLRTGDPPT